jgi:HPt (histidine-containing phosphotransfer) domain-containing protein
MSLQRPVQPESVECDPAKVLDHFAECPEILGQVAKLFREAYVPDMLALRLALERGDSDRFAFLAHKIKGSACYFQAEHVTALAAELEERGERGELKGINPQVEQLDKALASVSFALRQVEDLLAARS